MFTAQDIGSYKPNEKIFHFMWVEVKERFDIEEDRILHTAQSQFHDHHPAKKLGMTTSWISRPGAIMGQREDAVYDWKFNTLGDMADAVGREVVAEQQEL